MRQLERKSAMAELRRDYPDLIEQAGVFCRLTPGGPLSEIESIRWWTTVSQETWNHMYVDPRLRRLVRKVIGND